MNSRVALVVGVAAALLLLVLRSATTSSAQVPGPSPTPVAGGNSCGTADYKGGQTVTVLDLQITLPAPGDYSVTFGRTSQEGAFVRVCYVQGDSSVFFKADGSERNRVVNNASASAVLNDIARSVRQVTAPTPVPGGCMAGPGSHAGGTSAQLVNGMTVALPAPGDYFVLLTPPGVGPEALVGVCYVQGNATVYFSTTVPCQEARRTPASQQTNQVLDQIVGTCSVQATPIPSAPPPAQPPTGIAPPPTGIQPPNTGSGGLKSD